MIRSGAEIRAEVLKAARGAGLPFGVAEDLAHVAETLGGAEIEKLSAMIADPRSHGKLLDFCLARDLDGDSDVFSTEAPVMGAREVPDDAWLSLNRLASRTYVPESEQSRQSGAGAGNIDND
ncbi:MAG: DUF3726 domain-containing protein [Arenibacterium sp.]